MLNLSHIALEHMTFDHNINNQGEVMAFSLHCHHDFEVYFFIGGEGYYLIEGNRYELSPMSLLVIRPGEVHCFRHTGGCPYERYVINFSPEILGMDAEKAGLVLSPFLDREMGRDNLYRVAPDNLIVRLFDELDAAARLRPDESELEVRLLLNLLLTKIQLLSRQPDRNTRVNSVSSELISDVLKYINENITEPLRLDDIAARFYVSKYHLSRMFKKLIGVSVIDYVIRKRVFLSQQLLRGGMTTTDACAGAGFGDYTSFYRSFKRVTGCSPVQMKDRSAPYYRNGTRL